MPRWKIYDQPLQLPTRHPLELLGNDPVVRALDEPLVDVVREGHEAVVHALLPLLLGLELSQLQDLAEDLVRDGVQVQVHQTSLMKFPPMCR